MLSYNHKEFLKIISSLKVSVGYSFGRELIMAWACSDLNMLLDP